MSVRWNPVKTANRAMLTPFGKIISILCQIAERRDGAVAVIFGLAAIPVIIAAGMAIDTARAYMVKTRLGAALDAAALAVGSENTQNSTQLTTDLKNYFYNNYCISVPSGSPVTQCSSTVANETNVTVQPTTDITASVVTYQAQATVPMVFMQLAGVNNITVSATAQTTKFPGIEVAVVLDNTGSMLCGPNDGAPNYTDSQCAQNVVSADTNCTNSNNQSRICTLINAGNQFVNTLVGAETGPQQLYMSIVPYVTTVNVGNTFCSGATNCSHITQDGCSSDFLDYKGNIIYNSSQTPLTVATSTVTITGTTTLNNNHITSILPNTTGLGAGMPITGTGIPGGATISSVINSSQIQISTNATSSGSGRTLTVTKGGASTTSGSKIVTFASNPSGTLQPGMLVSGPGIPANTAIQTVDSVTQIHLCNSATATASFVALNFYTTVTYDSTYNSTNQNTTRWGGCVVEPTSSDENSGVAGVINSATTDPDTTEPSGGWPSWYPFWWASASTANNWWVGGVANVSYQNTTTETQGAVVATWTKEPGPNEGCPVPTLPLTDLTTTSGQTTVQNTINSMWPRDSGGTQVHIGMIWGWRVLSPNGPFAKNNGHPLDYATTQSTGWKKIIVLMTDGTEEWPQNGNDGSMNNLTGLGQLADGKIGTTSQSTALTNLSTRLQTVCNNLKASNYNGTPNYMIYTIGLGSDGASNTQLQNCAGNGGFFRAATPSNLTQVFQDIANSIIHLRLTR